jgi:ComF family protein
MIPWSEADGPGPGHPASPAPAWAVFVYTGLVPDLVLRLKYGRDFALARPMGRLMAAMTQAAGIGPIDTVLPVPSLPARQRTRGYNPAGLLADTVGDALQCAVCHRALVRNGEDGSQGRLAADARRQRVAHAFAAGPRPPTGPRVLLVDDVRTTGATLNACTRVLRDLGVRVVAAVTFARAPPRDH